MNIESSLIISGEIFESIKSPVLASLVVILLFTLCSTLYKTYFGNDPWNRKGFIKIPSPPERYPYIGHMYSLGDSPSVKLENWHAKHGPILHLYMGIQHWIFVSDPTIAHELMTRNGSVTSDRSTHTFAYEMFSKNGSGISFNKYGKKWKDSRSAVLSILSVPYFDRVAGAIESMADDVCVHLKKITENEGSVDPLEYIQMATYHTMIKAVLGKDVRSINDTVLKDIIWITHKLLRYASPEGDIESFLPRFSWIRRQTQLKKDMEEFVEVRDRIYKKLIKEAVADNTECWITQAHARKSEYNLNDNDLIVISSDLVSGGGENPCTSLMWLFGAMSQYPDIQKRVCAEIDNFIAENARMPNFLDRLELPYTCAVLKENLRFRNTSNFGIPHRVTKDIEALGYFIPKESLIVSSMHAMHMNPKIYNNPHEYMPERFLGQTKTWAAESYGKIDERFLYNFGWGRRICPGPYLAEMTIFIIAVRILAKFSIEPTLDVNGKPEFVDLNSFSNKGFTFAPTEYKVRFVTRNNNNPSKGAL
ncbi:cytochrome P450 [Phycomyces nitens]|nr:cytochrome P450 [Phycomyces nitens]